MEPRRRWGTALVVVSVIAFGGFGAAYLWKEFQTDSVEGEAADGVLVADAAADARLARGKPKPGKKGARGGRPRGGGRIRSRGPLAVTLVAAPVLRLRDEAVACPPFVPSIWTKTLTTSAVPVRAQFAYRAIRPPPAPLGFIARGA